MTKKIKIIDLLNKIANDEEVPKDISFAGHRCNYDEKCFDYLSNDKFVFADTYYLFKYCFRDGNKHLNDEVEILDKEYIGKQSIEATIKYIQVGIKGIIKEKELIKKYSKDEFEDIEHYDMFDYFGGYDFGGTDKELLCDLQMNFEHINNELDKLIKNQKKIIEVLREKGDTR